MKPFSPLFLSFWSQCLQLFLFFTLIFRPCLVTSSWDNETDHLSLLKFKESISSDPSHILDSWNFSTHFCNWHGITCGNEPRRVTRLVLEGYQLSGSISPFIGNLSFLRTIILRNNSFFGEIPQDLGRLFRLRLLSFLNNTLTGKFPVNITSCSKLRYLSFGRNNLAGKIPMEIGYLHNLERLYLLENNFIGQIPMSMWNLSSLTVIYFSMNNLEGNIPKEIGRLENLIAFLLDVNKLSGPIPSSLYNLSSLTHIGLNGNHCNGSLPSNMFNSLPNLQVLTLGVNQISGPIPASLANTSKLEIISVGDNSFSGLIPNLEKLHDLSFLELSFNNLGSNSSKDWEFLYSLSNCSKLRQLVIPGNNLGGHLPDAIGNLSTQLTMLVLGSNQIFGKIPASLGNLVGLTSLNMEMNHFTDFIPTTFGNFQNMQSLALGGNKFSGEIKHFIGNLTQLFLLDLSGNMFKGKVPPTIGNCKSLQRLDLSQNNFSGAIPVQLITLSSLSILLNLSHNSFGGKIPSEVGNLKNIGKLDASHNHISGKIPQAIGDCQSLEYLFLQGNFFQETIPSSLASLKALRHLDLSQNNLSGSIPKGLQDIALLGYLNVSFNMLDGEVPSKGVFSNASAISVLGNKKLCGGISKLELPPCPLKSTGQRKHLNFQLFISICCVVAFLLLASVVAIYHGKKRSKKSSSNSATIDMISKVSYQSLHNATDGFSINNLIGSGSSGSVYKGSFESNEVVAIKVINFQKKGAHKSFVSECNALRNAKHRNLVKVITCCSGIDYKGHEFKALVYKYMVNGSLENWLHPRTENLDHPRLLLLDQILDILIDIVSALNYLHNEYGQPLIHCDLKPSNVLLDGNMVAHLSDFGLARLLSTVETISNEQSSTIGIKGTIGYVPPEYGIGSEVSTQGDMYSFGILVLEMLTKRRPTGEMFKDGHNLQTYVKNAFPKKLLEVVSPTIFPQELEEAVVASGDISENTMQIPSNVEKCLHCLFMIGLTCSKESPHERMSVIDVARELNSVKSFFPLW
ncbi:probable LRR receptor-like serine/threonine-protein kinase At3g47570 [Neltuma alba]|uniref:probable LRR receptor-like serine/threonine-protein kinase At3g47570 n=1 Tax=Neltuma alba TaxID=207710 RepID=UPI0010A49457|nr:probable LRR receptor-like serine/threonine-protein kinase At3g47570 [Prosopis alba]